RRRGRGGLLAQRGRGSRAVGGADAGLQLLARLLRRPARRAAAGRPRPGAAGLLRCAHLPAHGPPGQLPHAVVGGPVRGGAVSSQQTEPDTTLPEEVDPDRDGGTGRGPDFRPVILGAAIAVYALARSFHEQHRGRSVVVSAQLVGAIS